MILSIYKRDTFNVVKLTVCIVTCIFLLSKPALQTDRDAFYPNFLKENLKFLPTPISGVAGPLAAQGGDQICRPFVLGF